MTRVWFNHGYSCLRDAFVMIRQEAGSSIRLLASHRDVHAPIMFVADETLIEPVLRRSTPEGEADYIAFCLQTCQTHEVDLFVAQSGRAALAPFAAQFAHVGTKLCVPADQATLKLIDDKARFYDVAMDAGLPMPWTAEVHDVAGYNTALDSLTQRDLVACVKPPQGVFGGGFWRLDDQVNLFTTLMNPDDHIISPDVIAQALATSPGERLLVLEYLAGPEWSLDCVCKDGELIVGVARRKLGRVQELEVDGPVFDIARLAVKTFHLSGLINIQCKANFSDGSDIRLLEINTRMSGGCLYTRFSGVKLPWIHIALELGIIDKDDVGVPIGGAIVSPSAEAFEVPKLIVDQDEKRDVYA